MNLEILFEDNHCLALNKPAGLPTQRDESGSESLVDLVTRYLRDRYGKPGNVYVGLLHRLDRPTSGVVLIAKTSKAAGRLSAQFREGTISKVYWAIVEGGPSESEGEWVDRLQKDRRINRSRMVAEGADGGEGGAGWLPGSGTLAGRDETRVAAADRPKSSAQGAVGTAGLADRGRREIRSDDSDQCPGWSCQDRLARPRIDVYSPDSRGSDRGRGLGAGRLARAFERMAGTAVLVQ